VLRPEQKSTLDKRPMGLSNGIKSPQMYNISLWPSSGTFNKLTIQLILTFCPPDVSNEILVVHHSFHIFQTRANTTT